MAASDGLYDFQEEAVEHCCQYLNAAGKSAVLALGTGMGKTVVARETLLRLGVGRHRNNKRALVVCPCGLGAQLGECLRKSTSLARGIEFCVGVANTGKDFRSLVAGYQDLDILVVNSALKWKPGKIENLWDFLVIDEAHKFGFTLLLRFCQSVRGPKLYITATPDSLRDLFKKHKHVPFESFNKAMFRREKTVHVMSQIGGALPVVRVKWLPEPEDYNKRLMFHLGFDVGAVTSRRPLYTFWVIPRSNNSWMVLNTASRILSFEAETLLNSASDRDMYRNWLRTHTTTNDTNNHQENAVVIDILYKVHTWVIEHIYLFEKQQQPWSEPLPTTTTRCMLARFSNNNNLVLALAASPPANKVRVVKMSTDMPAAKRAKLVNTLSMDRAPLIAFGRASQSSVSGALRNVLNIGQNWFLREVCSYVLPQMTVLATDNAVDLGYNLHRHVDSLWVSQVPKTKEEIQQLIGRLCRADTSRVGKGDKVSVVIDARKGTLDSFFLKRCGIVAT